MVISGWRAALWVVVGLVIVSLVLAAVFWIGVLLAAVALVGWFNLLVLPRVARRLRAPQLVLAIALLPLLAAAGFVLAGLSGVLAGGAVWTVGVALPRAVLWRLRGRLFGSRPARGETRLERVRVVDARFRA